MLEEGREAIFARHQAAGDYVRNRARSLGLQLLADHAYASNTVSSIYTPEGVETKALLKKLREDDHVVLAGGQGKLDGKIFRIGHLGYFEQQDLADAVDRLEARLAELGYRK
jgi:aspartate aminotransferase-like enzyme